MGRCIFLQEACNVLRIKAGSLALFLSIFSGMLYAQDLEQYVRSDHTDSIAAFLSRGHDVNGFYPDYTLLEMAIKNNRKDMMNILMHFNVDPNLVNHGNPALFYAIYFSKVYNDTDIINILLENGADIDKPGQYGATPLIYACRSSNYAAATLLYEAGADVSVRDRNGLDFFYYVLRGKDRDLIRYFLDAGFTIQVMASVSDGPYLKWLDENNISVEYLSYDSLTGKSEIKNKVRKVKNNRIRVRLPGEKYLTMPLNPIGENLSSYDHVSSIFTIGDLHGDFKGLVDILRANKVIDNKLNWSWGDGHLVICGDVFDRGDMVTECLWLIYKLESQAEMKGGRVHYVLGNHEMMILFDKNKFYACDPYIYTCARLGIDYNELFNNDYELGRWLRNKNTIIRLNNILFVHGGIPPNYPAMDRSMDKINNTVRHYLGQPSDSVNAILYHYAVLPMWYRDYFNPENMGPEIENILNYYNADYIVVGHTPVDEIMTIQQGRVIATNVPFGVPGIRPKALLILDQKFYIVDDTGKRKELIFPTGGNR